jgi:uncharacterized membrane-anchored protein YitT (DUF2179 family)
LNGGTKRYTLMFLKILIGSILDAAGISFLLYQNGIIMGGVMGISMILNRLLTTPVGLVTIALNVPLFILAWKRIGSSFFIGSLMGLVLSSVILDLFGLIPPIVLTENPILAGIFGGVVSGFGQGLIYAAGGSTGGVDIVAKILRHYFPYIDYGKIVMGLSAVIFIAYAVVFEAYENSLYSVFTAFIISRMVDTVLYGLNYSKVCYIITEKSEEVSKAITQELSRGVTMLYGRGAFSGREKMMLLCAIKKQQIMDLKRVVKRIDPDAFMIISEAREVLGYGFQYLEDKA